MNQWLDITDIFTKQGRKKIKTGQVLMFQKDGVENNLKIMRQARGKVWAKFVHLYHPDEIRIVKK